MYDLAIDYLQLWSNAFIVGILSKMMKSWSIVVANTAVIDLGCPWIEADVKTILTQKCLFIIKLGVNGRECLVFCGTQGFVQRERRSYIHVHNSESVKVVPLATCFLI